MKKFLLVTISFTLIAILGVLVNILAILKTF